MPDEDIGFKRVGSIFQKDRDVSILVTLSDWNDAEWVAQLKVNEEVACEESGATISYAIAKLRHSFFLQFAASCRAIEEACDKEGW